MSSLEVAVAICTYNRAHSLSKTLESLCEVEIPPECTWQLLLIDNNSKDGTREVADRFADKLPLEYFFEEKQGLSNARNRALKEHTGHFLIFTDDDVVFDRGWLAAFIRAFRQYAGAGYFGGKIIPFWNEGQPAWLRDFNMPLLAGLVGSYDLGDETRELTTDDMMPFGANFAVRRAVMDPQGPFDTRLGVVGRIPGRGEEAEYLSRAAANGVTGVYVPKATCFHHIPPGRFNWTFLYRYGKEKGHAAAIMTGESRPQPLGQLRFLIKGLRQLLAGRPDRCCQCVINMGIQKGLRQHRKSS